MNLIGQRIRQLRTEYGLTQETLSEILKLSGAAISNYENGVNIPDIETIIELANFFECSCDYILGRSYEKTPYAHRYAFEEPHTLPENCIKVGVYNNDLTKFPEKVLVDKNIAESDKCICIKTDIDFCPDSKYNNKLILFRKYGIIRKGETAGVYHCGKVYIGTVYNEWFEAYGEKCFIYNKNTDKIIGIPIRIMN